MRPTDDTSHPVNFGPLGRDGYVLSSRGARGWIVNRVLEGLRDAWQAHFSLQHMLAVLAAAGFLALGFGHLSSAYRASLIAERRFSPVKTEVYTVRHEQLRFRRSDATAKFGSSKPGRYGERAYVSAGDYWTDYVLTTLARALGALFLAIPIIGLSLWWRQRNADKAATVFGKGSLEHEAARQPDHYDGIAEEARRDWVLNPPRSERRLDPRNRRRPVFGSKR